MLESQGSERTLDEVSITDPKRNSAHTYVPADEAAEINRPRERITAPMNSQAEHHRRRTFQEELLALLELHEINYDPRYLWD